jgi:hypothetical protein
MAMAMLSAIPPTSQRYARANELHDRWSQQSILLNQAIAAKEVGDWQGVMNALKALEGVQLYQSAMVQELLQQATHRAYASDAALLQLAATGSSTAAAAALPNMEPMAPLPVSPPPASNLRIGIEQALEWARPSTQSSIALPSKAPKPSNSATPNPFAELSGVKSTVPVRMTPAWAD